MVFVLARNKRPLMPCSEKRARLLLQRGRARVHRLHPFAIRLVDRADGAAQPIALKLDPGSKTTGIALVRIDGATIHPLALIELEHRGAQIRDALTQRAGFRRGRRSRNLRYRAPRFDNRSRRDGWLPPSLRHRLETTLAWAQRLRRLAPISSLAQELARFDTQKAQNPEIAGVEYQQGTLAGYEIREYLLEKWGRACAYCDAKNVPLQIDHVAPKSRGGSDRVSNLTLACEPCNTAKGNMPVEEFLAGDPARLKRILAQLKTPLRDAAAVNATRFAIGRALATLDLPVTFWSGGRTKFNRCSQNYPKAHWVDAACVGDRGASVILYPTSRILAVRALGRGTRQVRRPDAHGFPRGSAKRIKDVRGFRTGDFVRLVQPSGKYAGTHVGSVAVRARGDFDIATASGKITAPAARYTLLQRANGYVA